MRFSIFNLLFAFLPIAFGCIWLLNALNTRPIEWRQFSVDRLESARSENKTTLILGLPHLTRGFNNRAFSQFDLPQIRRAFHSGKFTAMKCHYQTFSPKPGIPDREMAWLTSQVKGSYKEIVLIQVDPSGSTEFKRMFFDSGDVLDLMAITTTNDYFSKYCGWIAIVLTFLFAVHCIFKRPNKPAPQSVTG